MTKDATAPKLVSESVPIDRDVSMPARTRKANSQYPLDQLEVGHSFHVAAIDAKDDPVGRLSSTVSASKGKYTTPVLGADGKPVMKTVTKREYQRGANGKGFAKDANGKRILAKETKVDVAERSAPSRNFKVVKAAADDPRGPGARCFRIS